jgi:hypothetical protein
MKYLVLFLALVVLTSETCKKKKNGEENKDPNEIVVSTGPAQSIPLCIQGKIDSIKSLPKWNPPAEVHEYIFRGKRAFLFSADCCDFPSPLFDSACNYICAPYGGYTGKGDMQCPEFDKEAKKVRIVWKDSR